MHDENIILQTKDKHRKVMEDSIPAPLMPTGPSHTDLVPVSHAWCPSSSPDLCACRSPCLDFWDPTALHGYLLFVFQDLVLSPP